MPLVRISVLKGKRPAWRQQLGEAVHEAMVKTINVPVQDRFQVLSEHEPGDLVYDPGYLGIARSNDIVIIQVTMSVGRTLTQKRALYRRIAENLARLGVRREDVWVNLIEVAKENWSFGLGEASYVEPEKVPA